MQPAATATAPADTGAATVTTGPTATTGVPPQGGSGGTTAPAESQPGGAGDEEAIRVPAAFAIRGTSARPSVVAVPGFLTIELRLTSRDGRPHDVALSGAAGPVATVNLAAGGTAVKRLEGLRRGDYALVVDGERAGTLRVGTQPGP